MSEAAPITAIIRAATRCLLLVDMSRPPRQRRCVRRLSLG
jgi:hypothetical protein